MREINGIKYYSVSDIAKMLEISEISAREEIRTSQLKYIKIGRKKFIPFEELENYLLNQAETEHL